MARSQNDTDGQLLGGCMFREGLPKHALFPHQGIG